MGLLEISRQLAELIGAKAADLVADLVRQQHEEAKTVLETFANSKVNERYAELHRRVHEDIAGVELRLTAQLGSELGAVRKEAAANKQDLADRIAASELKLAERVAAVDKSATDRHWSTLRWLVTLLVVQSVFLIALGWMSKHAF